MDRMLILDLDGTLVDTVDDLAAAVNTVLRPRGLAEASRNEVRGLIGNGVAALLDGAFAARGAAVDKAALTDFLDYYNEHSAAMSRPFPGAVTTLESMSNHGWRFAVCTNKPELAARKLLVSLGLSAWCGTIGGGDSFPVRKPDPAHLLATLNVAGGTVPNAIMIGDHANDVSAANGAGVPCIFAAWGYGPIAMATGAAKVAADFSEAESLCEGLLPQRS